MRKFGRRVANKFKHSGSGSDAQKSSLALRARPTDPSDNLDQSSPATTPLGRDQDGPSVAALQSEASQLHDNLPPALPSSTNEFRKNLIKSGGWNAFKSALSAMKEPTSAFPPLQSAIGRLIKVLETVQEVSDDEDRFTPMAERLLALSAVLKKFEELEDDQAVRDRLDALTKSIERQVMFVEERMRRGDLECVLDASKDARDIINSLRELTFAVQFFEIDTAMNSEMLGNKVTRMVNDLREREILKTLNAAEGAAYNETRRTGCLDGTRVDTLSKILAWASDSSAPSVYWLNGMAGTGKSAIALSICKILDTHGRLGGSFFCSRQAESLSKIGRILPTVSFQLSYISEVYRREVVHILAHTSRSSYSAASLQEQMKDLFIEPSKKLPPFDEGTLIIVIDALDECSNESTIIDFLRVILRSDLPFKFLISSRPETHIIGGFSSQRRFESDVVLNHFTFFRSYLIKHASLRLHDVEADIVEDDIARYLKWKLAHVIDFRDDLSLQNDIRALAKKSGNLFIYAFTAVQYITTGANLNLSSKGLRLRLKRLLQSSGKPTRLQSEIIDNLYQQIFISAYSRKETEEIAFLRSALDTILCIFEPQSVSSIATILGEEPGDIRELLGNFHSVLAVPESDSTPVLTFHASFLDYVRDKSRSDRYSLNEKEEHRRLVLLCLKLMNHHLREDICDIKIRQNCNNSIHPSVLQERIPHGLRYACYFWASHLAVIGDGYDNSTSVIPELENFINHHLLHWLECLSITENLHRAVNCLQKARVHLSKLPLTNSIISLGDILAEAELVIPQCFQFLKIHALEIYSSALVWLPKKSKLCQQFTPNDKIPCLPHGLKDNWEACEQILQMEDKAHSLSFSQDESKLVVGLSDNTVRIWNVESGEELKKLEGHSGRVNSVSFSPGGSKLASGSSDGTVRIWNVESGEGLKKLDGHSKGVISVSFSPDGSKLASGSGDDTVRIWGVESGEGLRILVGHSQSVNSVSFSPDGSKLASGSEDETVRVWNLKSGEVLKKMEGHSECVNAVSFSSDGSKLASGSEDETVRIWDVESGEELKILVGHSDWVNSVSFSSDGFMLASGSCDNTVRIWNVESGVELKILDEHSNWVNSVSFSPDGSKLASGSGDKTVRIWNVKSGGQLEKLNGHSEWVNTVSFSSDGLKLVSGSDDKSVRIWDVGSGKELKKLDGHSKGVKTVSFSPNGCMLASAGDNTVRIWNVESGENLKKLEGHAFNVKSVSFSPDGSKLASGSEDKTVRIWNVESGEELKKLEGHSNWVNSVSFSSNGFKLASGSIDKTVRIWSLESGEVLQRLEGHSDLVNSVSFSHDGCKLASVSVDKTVRIWDVESGEILDIIKCKDKFGLIHLSDGSVLRVSKFKFTSAVKFELPVSASTMSLVIDTEFQRGCIVSRTISKEQPYLWLWAKFLSDICSVSFSVSHCCIGYQSGAVIIIELER